MAGTVLRRWNGNGGGRRWGPVFQVAGAVSSGKVAGPVAGGTAQMFSGFETDLRDVERYATQFCRSAPAAETDFGGAQCVSGAGPSRSDPKCGRREVANVQRGAAAQFGGAVAVPSGPPGRAGSFDVGGSDELRAEENTLSGTQFCGAVATLSGPVCCAGSVDVRTGDARHPSRDALVAQRHHSGGVQRHGRRTVSGSVAGFASALRAR